MRFGLLMWLVFAGILSACTPASAPVADAFLPGYFFLDLANRPTLVVSDAPGASPRLQIPLNPPTDCSLYALRPAPRERWIAVEWECSFGPTLELFDTVTGKSHFALSDPTIDNRFLAWQPDGKSIYLKIGTLSVPQTIRVDAATGKAIELPFSAFLYDLTVSPDGQRLLYSLTNGIGFGSETWLAGPDGQNSSQLLVDPASITALAQYSPDGRQLAFIKIPDDQSLVPAGELWLMDADGFHPALLAAADAGRGFPPVWSPDGSKIAFVGRSLAADPDSLNISIYHLSSAALDVVPVRISAISAGIFSAAWSMDGNSLLFSGLSLDSGEIVPVPARGDKISVWLYEISSKQLITLESAACCAGWIRK